MDGTLNTGRHLALTWNLLGDSDLGWRRKNRTGIELPGLLVLEETGRHAWAW